MSNRNINNNILVILLIKLIIDNIMKKEMVMMDNVKIEKVHRMFMLMEPEEVFKNIMFHVGKSVSGTLSNTAMIVHHEKFRNPCAAEMYYKYVVEEPSDSWRYFWKKT